VVVKGGTTQQEIDRGLTDLGAVDHYAKMFGFKVFTPFLKAMGHRCIQTGFVAITTRLNARLNVLVSVAVRGNRGVAHSYVLHCIQGKTTLAVVLRLAALNNFY
jgi:hypothetical protein